jgi:hypothetical protein
LDCVGVQQRSASNFSYLPIDRSFSDMMPCAQSACINHPFQLEPLIIKCLPLLEDFVGGATKPPAMNGLKALKKELAQEIRHSINGQAKTLATQKKPETVFEVYRSACHLEVVVPGFI